MTTNKRRLIVCDDETWDALKAYAIEHCITGYYDRWTVQATLRHLLGLPPRGSDQ